MPSALRTYAYDAIGRPYSDGSRSYSWNLADQITQISGVAAYGYDANGKRIKTTLQNGSVEYDLYDLQGQLAYSSKPGKQTDFLNLAGKPLAELVNGIPTFLHPDLLGSPRLATSATKAIVWREHFDPYGQKLNSVNDRTGYTGHAYDSESGLTYAQARFYDPMVGRFLSTDPITFQDGDPGTFNRYAYVSDSPYDHTDPTGMAQAQQDQEQQEEQSAPTGSHIVGHATFDSHGPISNLSSGSAAGSGGTGGGQSGGGRMQVAQAEIDPVPEEARPENSYSETQGPNEATEEFREAEQRRQEQYDRDQALQDSIEPRISFGRDANQEHHTFRHLDDSGFSREPVRNAIERDLSRRTGTSPGLIKGSVNLDGRQFDYHAYRFADGTMNVGRITIP